MKENIFDQLKITEDADLRDLKEGNLIYKVVDKPKLVLVTIAECIDRSKGQITFKDKVVLYCNINNYEQRYESLTFNVTRTYYDFKFLKLSREISPEYFL